MDNVTYIQTFIHSHIHNTGSTAMSGHRSTLELLLPMELTHTEVDVDALLLDGKQRLQAWNEKYSE